MRPPSRSCTPHRPRRLLRSTYPPRLLPTPALRLAAHSPPAPVSRACPHGNHEPLSSASTLPRLIPPIPATLSPPPPPSPRPPTTLSVSRRAGPLSTHILRVDGGAPVQQPLHHFQVAPRRGIVQGQQALRRGGACGEGGRGRGREAGGAGPSRRPRSRLAWKRRMAAGQRAGRVGGLRTGSGSGHEEERREGAGDATEWGDEGGVRGVGTRLPGGGARRGGEGLARPASGV